MFGFLRKKKREREPNIYPATLLLPYGFICREWDLTEDEQGRIRFVNHWGQKLTELTVMQAGAYRQFKAETFAIILNRLNVRFGPPIEFWDKRGHCTSTNYEYWSGFEAREDGKKIVGWRVEKKV